jgi:mannose-1-phosphate guanylyltransferase
VVPVLVLAAGLGTRLDPLTRRVAKAAVPLSGRTLIERVLDWANRQGGRDVVVNLHHLPQTITAAVGDGAQLGLRVRYSWERAILGSAGGPRHALPLLAESFVIANGDTLCDVDLPAMIDAHERRGAAATLAVVPNPAPGQYNGIVAGEHGQVRGFVPKGEADGSWHFVGIQVVSAALFRQLPDLVPAETVAGIYRDRVAAGSGDIYLHAVDVPFIDVGTPLDYLEAARACRAAELSGDERERAPAARDVDDNVYETPHPPVHESSRVRRSVLWSGSAVGPRVHLDECIVAGVDVPAGLHARRATLVPAQVVRPGESVETIGNVAVFPFRS